MTYILLATLAGFALLNVWFSERRIVVARTGDVFMLTWFYYGFAVAIDILLDFEIRGIPGMTNFSDAASQEQVLRLLIYYLMCGVAFCLAYACMNTGHRPSLSTKPLTLPPISVIILAHVLVFLPLLYAGYLELTRPQRMLLMSESLPLRLTMLSLSVLRAFDFIIISSSQERKHTVAAAIAAISLGLLSGGRMELMSVILILALKYRISCGRFRFALIVIAMLVALACWKSTYHYIFCQVLQEEPDRHVLEFANTSLSGIESYTSSLIAVSSLEGVCPYFLGKTYIYDTFQAIVPREWRDPTFMTLSQTFAWDYVPKRAEEGIGTAFSAIAEAWLNFGVFGPALLGLVFGFLAKKIDSQNRGIAFYIFALLVFRLFRSDFASLCKSWIVIYGGSMVVCYYLWTLTASLLVGQPDAPNTVRPWALQKFSRR